MPATWVLPGASVALAVVTGCHFGLFADLAASPYLLELLAASSFALPVLLAVGSVALAAVKLQPSPVIMATSEPPATVNDGSDASIGRPIRQSSIVPTTLKVSTDKSTAFDQDNSTPRAPQPPSMPTSTLRVTEISVEASVDDEAGSTATNPSPKLIDVPLNSILEPYEFENEFVRGKLVFMVDSADNSVPEPAEVRTKFEGRRRLFWVQVQLEFKVEPSGIVYIGGEVPRPMSLGFFTGGMTKVILSVLQSLVPGLHYSFGNSDSDNDSSDTSDVDDKEELPHICFPLYTAVDQFVATPPGETPPTLGSEDFGETKEQSQQRRRSGLLLYPFNTRDTYSFHFHSFFIDFAHWQLVNLPGLRNTDLRAFWNDMPLRIVCYSLNDSSRSRSHSLQKPVAGRGAARRATYAGGSAIASNAKKAVHSWAAKEYKFCLELRPQDPTAVSLPSTSSAVVSDPAANLAGTSRDIRQAQDAQFVMKRLDQVHRELSGFEIRVPAWFEYFSHTRTHSERRVGYVIAVHTLSTPSIADDDEGHDGNQQKLADSQSGQEETSNFCRVTGEYVLLHTALAAFTPLSHVERVLPNHRVDGSKSNSDEPLGPLDHSPKTGRSLSSRRLFGNRSRSVEESISVRARSLNYSKIDDERQFLELQLRLLASISPSTRIGLLPEQLCAAKTSLFELLQSRQSPSALEIEWPFLSAQCAISSSDILTHSNKDDASSPSALACATTSPSPFEASLRPASPLRTGRSCQSAQVLRIVSSGQWRNECMTLHPAGHTLRFFRTQSSSCKLAIAVDQVLSITMGSPAFSSCWCRSYGREADATVVEGSGGTALYWLHIGLVEKCHHVAFASPEEQEKWLELLSGTVKTPSPPGSPLPATPVAARSQPTLDLLLKQSIMRSTSRLSLESFAVDVCVGGGNGIGSGKPRSTKRFVLNERCLVRLRGVCACSPPESPHNGIDAAADAGDLVRRCLRQAIKLQAVRLDDSSTDMLLQFQDSVCALRWVDLTAVAISDDCNAESERKALFLNLFHLMMLHASILGLLPKSKTKWAKFFNGVTYNVGGMYWSLAEIEHGVLRAAMSPLRLPIAFLVIPRLGEPEVDPRALLRLERPDFRLNFAMNCMTRSCSASIVVFDVENLDEQLDHVVSETIARSLLYDCANHIVQLPKVCDWYRDDFSTVDSVAATTATAQSIPKALAANHAILGLLLPFVRGPQRPLLEYAWQHPLGLVDKYTFEKYDYRFQDALIEASPVIQADD